MATYKGIQGFSVQNLSSDPTASEATGQLFYNSGTGKFKIGVAGTGAWSEGGTLNTPRMSTGQGGIQTAAVCFGGRVPADTALTEEYNGTAWTEVNPLNAARTQICGFGIVQTAVIAAGPPAVCETYDGTSWSEGNDQNSGAISRAGVGTATAGLAVAGLHPTSTPTTTSVSTETYDGTSWTQVNNINTGRKTMGNAGTQTAAIVAGGNTIPGAVIDIVEEWDGTSWAAGTALAVTRGNMSGDGTQTDAMIFGGIEPGNTAKTEKWNGSSWTEVGDLATARSDLPGCGAGAGTTTTALCTAGYITPSPFGSNLTEEWTDPVYSIETVTVS